MESNAPAPIHVHLYFRREMRLSVELKGILQLGRQRPDEPPPFSFDEASNRVVIADVTDKLISREQLEIRRVPAGNGAASLSIRNLSAKRPVTIDCFGKLGPNESIQQSTPVVIAFEDFVVKIESQAQDAWEVRPLPRQTIAPGRGESPVALGAAQRSIVDISANDHYSTAQLVHWLGETMEVLQRAAGASDFLKQAVDAVDRIIGLDAIAAIRFKGREWEVVESKQPDERKSRSHRTTPSNTIMQQVLSLKRTIRHLPSVRDSSHSLQGVEALVASPILDTDENVIGAIYGVRYGSFTTQMPQISELEATMVEVIACSAAAGIAREVEHKKALAARVLFEQFFTPQLARELEADPQMLEGREASISVLFCDIVRFSAISQRIGSHLTLRWISDVMDRLSAVVLAHDGVVVDYIGDELMAMWGAPKPQADHALKVCLAACDLLRCKGEIDQHWRDKIGESIDFRTGICSGIASVGNIGSTRKFKYGPLGETVNLASRLQGVAKHLGVRQLISQQTAAGLTAGGSPSFRPLGTVRVVNMEQPVEVFELCEHPCQSFDRLAAGFQNVLQAIKNVDLQSAYQHLVTLQSEYPQDKATHILAARLAAGERINTECLWHFDTK